MEKTKISNFVVRLDPETMTMLEDFARSTHRTKAQAARAAIRLAAQLFASGDPSMKSPSHDQRPEVPDERCR